MKTKILVYFVLFAILFSQTASAQLRWKRLDQNLLSQANENVRLNSAGTGFEAFDASSALGDGQSNPETIITNLGGLVSVVAVAKANPSNQYSTIVNGAVELSSAAQATPKNLTLYFINNGKFVWTTGDGILTVNGQISAPRKQIFEGFSEYTLRLRGSYEALFPEWFGAKGDAILDANGNYISGTNDHSALQLMFRALRTNQTGTGIETGGRYVFGQKVYYSGNTLSIANSVHILGTGGAGDYAGAVIKFPHNVLGFDFHGASTERGGTNGTTTANSTTFTTATAVFNANDVGSPLRLRDAAGTDTAPATYTATIVTYNSPTSVVLSAAPTRNQSGTAWYAFETARTSYQSLIERVKIIGETGFVAPTTTAVAGYNGVSTHTVDINPTFPTVYGTANFPVITLTAAAADEDFVFENGYSRGLTVTIGKSSFIVENMENTAATTNPTGTLSAMTPTSIRVQPLRFATSGLVSPSIVNGDTIPTAEDWWIGGTLKFDNDTTNYTITGLTGGVQISPSKAGTYQGVVYIVPPARTGVKVRFNKYHGIQARSRIEVRDCGITGFAGNGINFNTNLAPTAYFQGEPNANYAKTESNRIVYNSGHGILTFGKNANAMSFYGNDVSSSGGYGYYDVSDLGSSYFANHAASNVAGHYFSANGGVNRSNFFANYGETQSPASFIGQYSLWVGGNNASGFMPSEGVIMQVENFSNGAPNLTLNSNVKVDGDVYVTTVGRGLILRDDNGGCWRYRPNTSGQLPATGVAVGCNNL